jgi:hypothetical protein
VGHHQQRLDAGVGLPLQGAGQQRRHAGIGVGLQRLGRGPPHRGIRVEQLEGREGVGELAAEAVVHRHRLGLGRHVDGRAGGGVEGLLAADDQRLVPGDIEGIVGHRLEHAHGVRVGRLRELADGGDLVGGIFRRQLADLRRVEGRVGAQAGGAEQYEE